MEVTASVYHRRCAKSNELPSAADNCGLPLMSSQHTGRRCAVDTSHLSLRHRGAHFHSLAEHRRLSCADVAQAAEVPPDGRMLPCLETYCTALVQGQVAATTHQSSDAAAVRICRGEVATDFTLGTAPHNVRASFATPAIACGSWPRC